LTPEFFMKSDAEHLPGVLDIKVSEVKKGMLKAQLVVSEKHLSINGFLHAGTIIALADTGAGYGCMSNLPEGASGFTTIELKSNLISSVKEGVIFCISKCVHSGRTTQVWESKITSEVTGKTLAKFTCTQLVMYPK